jgi:hypothetical protein
VIALPFGGEPRLRRASCPAGGRWLQHVELWRPHSADAVTTGAVETAVVLLHGTFDLVGGGTAWPARGARTTPLQGRPMAVFLPPDTVFQANGGNGELLLVAARQPVAKPIEGRAALSAKPLLPLAGSGKAFDPGSGEWKPAETFPTAAESLPPRRMERIAVGAVTVERVLAPDYKAATLSLDEVVLPAAASLRLGDIPGRATADELLVFVRSEATASVGGARIQGDAAFLVPADAIDGLVLTAGASPAYVLLAYAGKAPGSGS